MGYICMGCGADIQTVDKNATGYVPKRVLDEHDDKDPLYCQRCFRIKHYMDVSTNNLTNDDYLKVISQIGDKNGLVVLTVDIFDFSGSFVPQIKRLTGAKDVIIVGNKVDLLPKSTNKDKILNWLKNMCADEGLSVLDAVLVSAKKGYFIDELMKMIYKYKGNRDVYFVGSSNVGKSKLINQILKRYAGTEKDVLTVSYYPETTIGLVGFPLEDGTSMYDTPGILNRHQYLHYITRQSLKMIIPGKEINPQIFQLDPEQTLFIGGLARIDFLSGSGARIHAAMYFSNRLNIHRTKTINADELFNTKRYSLLVPPFSKEENIPKFKETEIKIRDTLKYDIVISGLGFVSIKGPFKVKVQAPAMVGVYVRKAII